MVSKNQIKLITSLQQKKFRQVHKLFIAEGAKVIEELLNSNYELHYLYQTELIFKNVSQDSFEIISEQDLKKITALTTPNNCLALFKIPVSNVVFTNELTLVLDDIRDPGNLGTIIRLCDWFGIKQLVCSMQTVDIYNPKVIQATMGSISRVSIVYQNLEDFLSKNTMPVYGTFMDGKNVYGESLIEKSILILGNEANGISSSITKYVTNSIAIPRFGNLQVTESLNVATATAIFLSEFKRKS